MTQAEEKFRAQDATMKKQAFGDLMASPPIRLLLSMIPSGDHPETMTTLLEEAFNKGWSGGQCMMSVMMLESMLRSPRS